MKKTIRDFKLENKKVIIRVDFNVPIKNGVITDDNRIKQSLPTIQYALQNNAKIILLSHLGRVKTEDDKVKNDLKPVAQKLSDLLKKDIIFIDETRGEKLEKQIDDMLPGEIVLIQNTRYEDSDEKKESNNDEQLGKYWASLGDIYINDAFGTSHRSHASNVGIASYLPSGIGFLIEKELEYLGKAITNPKRPLTVILGGAKVADKIGVIENLVHTCDYLLIGGAMAYTFLKSQELPVGLSLVDEESIDFCKEMLQKYKDKIILPIDTVNGREISEKTHSHMCFISDTKENEIGLDIGHATVKLFTQYIQMSETIIWNGPVGMFELEPFSHGTKALCEVLSHIDATTIIGGGDTASAIINMGYQDKMTHISTGGGSSLVLLEGKKLPGIEIIDEK